MSRYLTDDYLNKDPRALLNSIKMASLSETAIPEKKYITVTGSDALQISEGCIFSLTGGGVFKTGGVALSASNLDTGSAFAVGKDYYIYICDVGGTEDELYKISLNSTYPSGYGADASRKIGGFHYGKCRMANAALEPTNAAGEARGTGWESSVYNGIVPRSVWTLAHRPKCSPEGMVYLGHGVWVDIYLASDDGASGVLSKYNATPLTGTEGLNWYGFVERMFVSGKRLLTYSEFCMMAKGSPQDLAGDNTNAWTGGAARQLTGYVDRAVSSIGCRDAVGNVWEWLDELITNASGRVLMGTANPTSYTYNDGGRAGQAVTNGTAHGATTRADGAALVPGAWGWDRLSPWGDGYGNIYEYYDQNLIALVAGGDWGLGVAAGARAVHLGFYPWNVNAGVGARGACDCL
jgi:hypothetical protein